MNIRLRHDAAQCRAQAKSESLRHSLGILTPEEQARKDEAAEAQRQAEAKQATKGSPLFEDTP